MPRGSLPTYERVSHIPNILEAYRYLTRANLTVLSSTLSMSYHTVRRLCITPSRPQNKTLEKLQRTYAFINPMSWDMWIERCSQALHAEKHYDIVTLSEIEDSLKAMLPQEEVIEPIHFMPEASIDFAKKLYEGTGNSKAVTYYMSNIHSTAVDLLAIHAGLTKSEYLRSLIDDKIRSNPEVAAALIEMLTGAPTSIIKPQPSPESIEVSTKELSALLPSNIDTKEALAQLKAELPEAIETEEELPRVEPPSPLVEEDEDIDLPEIGNVHTPDWLPTNIFTKESNLSPEELESMFSGD